MLATLANYLLTVFRFIQPCSPIRAKEVPAGDGWLHEVKFDGYRVQAHKDQPGSALSCARFPAYPSQADALFAGVARQKCCT
jgi:hypothetical protein